MVVVNGIPAGVGVLGLFSSSVELQEGPNMIDGVAADLVSDSIRPAAGDPKV